MPNKVVFITALPVEFEAVRGFLSKCEDKRHSCGNVYKKGEYLNWQIGLAEIGQGNSNSALETERAIAFFKPDYVFFVGVAGGIKDVTLGDVVIAELVKGYEKGKETNSGFLPRGDLGQSNYELVQQAKAIRWNPEWFQNSNITLKPKALVGTIAAGEKVVASEFSTTHERLTTLYSEALAVEMEGIGFLTATHANNAKGIVIRGISDLLSDKEASDKSGWQKTASLHAAVFAFEMLKKLTPTSDPKKKPLSNPDKYNTPCANNKIKAFANYKKERQALDTFITAEACKKRILLIRGNEGYGKSSLVEPYLVNSFSNIYLVHIQLRNGENFTSIIEFFLAVSGCIGGMDKLPTFDEQLKTFHTDYNSKEYHAELIASWFQDINILNQQVVLIIDTYEDGIEKIRNWINECFLKYVAVSSILRVVIVGREVPSPNIAWGNYFEYCNLDGVKDAEHWLPVIEELRRKVPEEHDSPVAYLRQVCDFCAGRPHEIMKIIEMLPQ